MRLDKYLKVTRLIRRRTVAKEVTDNGRVAINDRIAKAGTVVNVGDEIEISFGQRKIRVRVEQLRESPRKEEADSMYTVLSEERTQGTDMMTERD